ncbi:protein of unknown function DUF820 [hydrothermal vent metagenome]|uniref:Putative restriction endonuclease domain-containing protein n=1 Tax=hydrothermal vent metagenome TaxID=652676 RepID=A0A1W1EHS6_9ZZZZ
MNEALKLENYTFQDYLEIDMNSKERVELIFGDIYMMVGASAYHQDIVLNLGYIFKSFTKNNKKCIPRVAPFDIKLKVNQDISVVQPDVMILCQNRNLPCAIFEVLSPSTAYKDKTVKKDLYEASGVKEYFLVNIEFKTIDRFKLKNKKYIYDRAYGVDDKMRVDCLDCKIDLSEVFE